MAVRESLSPPKGLTRDASDAGAAASYGRHVILAVALAGAILFIAAGLAWTARLVHIGDLDAQALAKKSCPPRPWTGPRTASTCMWWWPSPMSNPSSSCMSAGRRARSRRPRCWWRWTGPTGGRCPCCIVVRRRGIGLTGQARWRGAGASPPPEPRAGARGPHRGGYSGRSVTASWQVPAAEGKRL